KKVMEDGRTQLDLFQPRSRDGERGTADLDDGTAERRLMTGADDTPDRAFASDRCGFHFPSVRRHHEQRTQGTPAGEIGGFNVLPGFEENLAATYKPEREMRFYQRPIFASEGKQQPVCTIFVFGCDSLSSTAQ